MASIDLGMVTAYAYAVAGGYTGSEQDFEDLLGNIASDLEEIENLSVTVTTLPEGSQATASYNNGVLSLGIPKGDTGATGAEGPEGPTGPTGNGISGIAKTGTSGNVDTYTITYTNGQTTTFTVTNGEVTQASFDALNNDYNDLKEALIEGDSYKQYLSNQYYQGVVHNGAYNNPYTGELITVYGNLYEKNSPFGVTVSLTQGYKALVVFFASASDTSPVTSSWLTGTTVVSDTTASLSKNYFCIEVRKTDNSNITPAEASTAVTAYFDYNLLPDRKTVINVQQDMTTQWNITETCDIIGNGHTINVGQNSQYCMQVLGDTGVVVNVYDMHFKGGSLDAVRVSHFATVNFYNCTFEDAAEHGLSVVNGNTNCFDCLAQNNGVDGFNYHFEGKNTVYNCYSLNNGDDGISNHEQSTLKIVGGKYIGNGKAGIAAPTYGSDKTEILDVYCADNAVHGLLIYNETAVTEQIIVQNAIIMNSPVGITVSGYQVITNGVKYSNCTLNNQLLNGGTITAL